MPKYDFTIRAKDESGAFSDREFSIQVKNNIVARMVVAGANNLYVSTDGIEFTTRAGKGGAMVKCLLGKWVVFQTASTYRTSIDTINWEEGKEVSITSDGVKTVYNINTSTPDHIIELNGYVYALVSRMNGATQVGVSIIRTRDLETWEKTEFNDFFPTLHIRTYSNMIVVGDEIVIMQGNERKFAKLNTLTGSTEIITPSNQTVMTASQGVAGWSSYYRIFYANGVYVAVFSGGSSRIHYSTDLVNINSSPALSGTYRNNSGCSSVAYYNGNFIANAIGNILSFSTPQELLGTAMFAVRDMAVFKGRLYLAQTGATTSQLSFYDGMPTSATTPTRNIATGITEVILNIAVYK